MLLFYLNLLETEKEKSKFEELYYEYKTLMMYKALEIFKNKEQAEDAVHEAFIKLTRYLDRIEDIKSHKTKSFIVIIIRCVSLDIMEKENRRKSYHIDNIEEICVSDDNVFEKIEIKELCSKIKSLPETYRDVLELKVYYDLSDKAMADILGISNQAVRKRLQRARYALKKILSESGDI